MATMTCSLKCLNSYIAHKNQSLFEKTSFTDNQNILSALREDQNVAKC